MLFDQETLERIIQHHLFLLRIYWDFTVVIKNLIDQKIINVDMLEDI